MKLCKAFVTQQDTVEPGRFWIEISKLLLKMVGEKRGHGRNRYLPFSGVPKSGGRSKPSSPPSSGLDQSRSSLDRARQRLKQKQRGLDEQRRCLEKQLRSLDERRRIVDEKLWRLEEEQLGLDENRPSTSTNGVAPPTIVLDSPSSPRPRPPPLILQRRPMANRLALARGTSLFLNCPPLFR